MLTSAFTKHHGLRRAGFTIIEILISIVIIALAFAGILAMLAGSTKLAGEVVEDTFATTLARSVYEAVRECSRKNAFLVNETGGSPPSTYSVTGFVLNHEGVVQQAGATSIPVNQFIPPSLPASTTDTASLALLRASDFTMFLPNGRNPSWTGGGTGEPVFIFPRPTTAVAENVGFYGTDDFLSSPGVGNQNQPVWLNVQRVYSLKERAPATGTTYTGPSPMSNETADQYSFAIAFKRAVAPPIVDYSASPPAYVDWKNPIAPWTTPFLPVLFSGAKAGYNYTNGLYQVEVRVYRNFQASVSDRHHEPVAGGGFMGLLAFGKVN